MGGSSSGGASRGSTNASRNDVAGPRKDASGRNVSSASRPSSGGGYNGGGGGNAVASRPVSSAPVRQTNATRNAVGPGSGPPPGTGLSTGATMYGNTAYGPAGGNAVGYATMTRPGAGYGMGPSVNTYSNYRNLDGSPTFAGNPSIAARNAGVGANALAARQAAIANNGGLLGGSVVPASITPQYTTSMQGGIGMPAFGPPDADIPFIHYGGAGNAYDYNRLSGYPSGNFGSDQTYPGGYGQMPLAPGGSRAVSPSSGLQNPNLRGRVMPPPTGIETVKVR